MSNWIVAVLFCVALLAVGLGGRKPIIGSARRQGQGQGQEAGVPGRGGSVSGQGRGPVGGFYTKHLGFKVEQQFGAGAPFASVSNGGLTLWLSGPMSSGARALPDGRKQEPGGWNRIVLEVDDLPSRVEALKKAGLHFRNEIEKGPGGKQIQLEDPDGNPIELFEPAK